MTEFAARYFRELWNILLEMAPWLLFGMFVAGLLHVALPRGFIHRRFGKRGFWDVVEASALGVPLPLCSCGVIPAAIGLKKDGASNGASTGFLISTPQTGVDSIMVSASFLGWPFAIFKVVSALAMGLIGGWTVNLFERGQPPVQNPDKRSDKSDGSDGSDGSVELEEDRWRGSRVVELFRFGFGRLLRDVYVWIVFGILVAALIGTLVPPDYFTRYAWMQGFGGMALMLLIATPLYVCATGSVPIAATLIHAGLPAGSALVFLMAGPATNVATIGAVYKAFGKRVMAIYLTTVIVMSMLLGWSFQWVVAVAGEHQAMAHVHGSPHPIAVLSATALVALMAWFAVSDLKSLLPLSWRAEKEMGAMKTMEILVEGMTCQNCAAHVKRALESVEGVSTVKVDLENGRAAIAGDSPNLLALIAAVTKAGYKAREA